MADNLSVTAGTGTTIAADDIGGALHQRVKMTWGVDGSAVDASASNPLPVVQTGTPALPTGAATAAKQPALGTAGTASTDVITVQGIASGTAQPVSIATAPVLVAGSAVIGKVSIDQTTPGTTNLVDTELPAAAALADGASNPTTPMVGANLMGWNGATWDRVRVQSVSYDMNAIAITTVATVATPTSGKQIRLMGGSFSVSSACSVLFENNAASGTKIFRTPQLIANTPYNFDLGNGVLVATANNVLKATASTGTVTITGTLRATEE